MRVIRTPSLRAVPAAEGEREIHVYIATEGWKKVRERGEGIESASHRRERAAGRRDRDKMREGVRPITQADGANQGAMRLP